jgi:2-keto-4-pentenoate hydratase/2-oxohepta-3-ene-1,7-dioic acid hydratase in catechol pathway
MKLISFSTPNTPIRPGILFDDTRTVLDLSPNGFSSTLEVIASGTGSNLATSRLSLDNVRLHAPLSNPPRIFAIGLNYRDHAKESGMEIPTTPVVFFKLATAIIGPGDSIVLPKNSTQPDYEAEFAFVIGKGGYRIPATAWREHVYGYTIVNDVSARDVQFSSTQWSMSKCFPTFCPLGPAIVTADEIADPHNLEISLSIDGEQLQHSNTRELVFKIPELIEYLSSITPLLPGDIISTGTPPGVGLGRKPKRLGSLTNPVVAE